ncbi:MAG: DUF5057 domain-containing protein [Lachnospiraceae bacterium]|nr:DUF5057 domain-containing protein [Lachnospiraceae bacterium]
MKRNMKLKVTALVAMLFMAIAVTFLSFSHADEEIQDDSLLMADASTAVDVGSKTNIDYIIMNSNSTDPDVDPHYNIVEIYSDKASGLEGFAENLDFENYVINGYSTLGEAMKSGMVNYTSYQTKEIKNDSSDILKEISNADLIYVNQGSSAFSKTNDICENLYDILHTYAVGDYKPLIINSEKKSGGSESSTTTQETMGTLATDVFYRGMYYYTFAWDTSKQSLSGFLTHNNGSMYLGINGKTQEAKKKWTTLISEERDTDGKVKKDAEGNTKVLDTKKMAKFLVLSGDGTAAKDMRSQLLPSTLVEYDITGYRASDSEDDYTLPTGSTSKIYRTVNEDGSRTIVVDSIYNAKYTTPDLIQVDEAKLTDIGDSTFDLSKYDFILIDETAIGNISTDIYNKLAGAMYGSVSIVYPSSLETSTTISSNTVTDTQAYNYLELYYMVATTENISRYDNVMVTSEKELNTIMSGEITGAGAIATLINKSTYRGIGGKGSSSNMFTVLEIQPCYPIDPDVAAKNLANNKFGYYNIPANVLNDVDKDTLSRDDNGVIDVEYYDWELSKKKIADAIGIDASMINVVHMSTEELAASKEPLLGTYDLIYIGGNTTALKTDISNWRSIINTYGGSESSTSLLTPMDAFKYLPVYTMYSHNGDIVRSEVVNIKSSGGMAKDGTVPTSAVDIGTSKNLSAFTLLNGNDISYDRLVELKAYIGKGMPVIIEDDVTGAYETMIGNKTNDALKEEVVSKVGSLDDVNLEALQTVIDPDCNIRKFLDECYTLKNDKTSKNVLWGIDNTSDDALFKDYLSVNTLVKSSNKRPKLTVTSMPVVYNYYDQSTRLDEGKLNFKFEVTGSDSYTVKLLVDDAGDNTFKTDVSLAGNSSSFSTAPEVNPTSLNCILSDKFYGPVYWKLEVTDTTTGINAYVKGVSYVKNNTGKPQTVRVLQIMPGEPVSDWSNTIKSTVGEGASGGTGETNSLYFCPICQNAYQRLENNPVANNANEYNMRYSGNYSEESYFYLGKHEHIFGIPMYDSERTLKADGKTYEGCDDWSTNLADSLSDLYEFDLDIMLRGEFEAKSREVAALYDFSKMTDDQKQTKIDSFSISADSEDYDKWNSLASASLDAKLTFITQIEQKQLANDQKQLYDDAKADTSVAEQALRDALTAAASTEYGEEFKGILATKRYSDIYSCAGNGTLFRYAWTPSGSALDTVKTAYAEYMKLKDIEIGYHQAYRNYEKLSDPEWLTNSYDMIIIGPSDDFGGDDIKDAQAIADLITYLNNKGSMLLFHDTLAKSKSSGSVNLTENLRGYFGMDRNRGLTLDTSKASVGMYYLPYKISDPSKYSADRYFMTNLSYKTSDDKYANWLSDLSKVGVDVSKSSRYLSNVVYTDSILISQDGFNKQSVGLAYPNSSPYLYGDLDWMYSAFSYYGANYNAKDNKNYGTDKATQNNMGIVTQYPFTLSDQLNISGTHPQAYALELDSSKMTVWYSLAGGTKGSIKDGVAPQSSMFAASRNDGMDSYFIYSYGNVNYCGAGHSKVTGIGKDNNDERRLYINIIVNSVRPSISQPGITVYDYGTEKVKSKDGTNYLIEVADTDAWPTFSFSATVDSTIAGNKLARVRIYYDLDFLTHKLDMYVNDEYHILIADMTQDANGNPLKSGTIYDVGKELTKLQLKPEYFYPYNQEYTYIVIEVTDSNGNIAYQRIKIKLLPYLFEMTQNNINHVIDMIDKI